MDDPSIRMLRGVGDKTQKLLSDLQITRVSDLLSYYPRAYRRYPEPVFDLSEAKEEEFFAFFAKVPVRPMTRRSRSLTVTVLTLSDTSDNSLTCIWYRMPYMASRLKPGFPFLFYGKIKREKNGSFRMDQPDVFTQEQYRSLRSSLQPVYSLTRGLTNQTLKKLVYQALSMSDVYPEYLPEELLGKKDLISYPSAVRQIHFPDSEEEMISARRRLSYDEFLDFFLRMKMDQAPAEAVLNQHPVSKDETFCKTLSRLPFALTAGQKSALLDLVSDFHGSSVTQRLIQGDVGSGKTIVAFLAMVLMSENGYQSLLMAPTEVLARQHYETFLKWKEAFELPYEVLLLTGSVTGKNRKKVYETAASTPSVMIIGTNALISEAPRYYDLGLVITDEQHRFGVRQRSALSGKGRDPFVVVMSATPIPRTLALILYQDMDISMIRDLPKDRLPIKNALIPSSDRSKALRFLLRQIAEGRQAYIICPLVESSDATEAENVTDYAAELEKSLPPEISVGIMHGRLAPTEKERVMDDFLSKKTDILVSTTVVEVGVNVPNATVMMIENADRFGLAQLHQLRGRVGRGAYQSYCIFLDGSKKEEASERLRIVASSNDGFEIANEDMRLRGPGEMSGIRQSGELSFGIADIYRDADLLKEAAEDARDLLAKDPGLSKDEHAGLKEHLKRSGGGVFTNL